VRLIRGVKSIFGRISKASPCCTFSKTTVFHGSARIVNNRLDPSVIVIGPHTHIKGEILNFGHGGRIEVGEYCFIGEGTHLWSAKHIRIGNRVLISHNVNIFDNDTHPINANLRHKQYQAIITSGQPRVIDLNERPVEILDDAWIGCMVVILPGVTIGEGAIVGAGSVVTKDVPPYTIVGGNPARVIRELTPQERGEA